MECKCGTEAEIFMDRWTNWVQLNAHCQPSGVWCNFGRLQAKNASNKSAGSI